MHALAPHTARVARPQVQRTLGGTAGEEGRAAASGRALFHIALRTSSPGVVASIERDVAAAFVADLAPGCLELEGAGGARGTAAAVPRVQGGVGLKPPLHPRVAALHASFQQGVRALPVGARSVLSGGAVGAGPGAAVEAAGALGAGTGAGAGAAQDVAAGAKVSHDWMAEAALGEWQRLVALSSV